MTKKRRPPPEAPNDPAALLPGGALFRAAGAPTKALKKVKRENGYAVEREVIVLRTLNLRPMAPCPYGLD